MFSSGVGSDTLTLGSAFSAKWGWYGSIDQLAGGDVLKYDEVTALPLFQCLTKLAFDKERSDLEKKSLKK